MKLDLNIQGFARLDLNRSTRAIGRALERLSTGKRVNSPSDDPAAYSMGVNLEASVRGLNQGSLNINQAQSLLNTAESSIQSQLDLVQRMRELAVEASNGTLSTADRENINTELQGLIEEFSRITNSTTFNDLNLLNGDIEDLGLQLGSNFGDQIDFSIENLSSSEVFTKTAGTGAFSFGASFSAADMSSAREVKIGDLNNDGHLDAVFSDTTGSVFLGNGAGSFSRVQTLGGMSLNADSIDLKDFNSDGVLDVAYVTNGSVGMVRMGNGDGTFSAAQCLGVSASYISGADFDGDGDQDVVVASGSVMSVLLNNGQGAFSLQQTFAASLATSPVTGDLTGDGKAEIIALVGTTLTIYNQNPSGTFSVYSTADAPATGAHFALGDLDSDGDLDVASSNNGTGLISLFVNSGSGTFTRGTTLAASGTDIYGIEIADFNEDGNQDIVVSDSSADTVSTFLGLGTAAFKANTTTNVNQLTNPYPFGVGDFNEDGALDLLIPDRSPGKFGTYLGQTEEITALIDLNLRSQSNSQTAIEVLDNALTTLTGALSNIGALHNRLDSALSANLLVSESLSEAQSRSIDADIAEETSELVKNQILQQAQVAVMAQANVSMQMVLGLLRF